MTNELLLEKELQEINKIGNDEFISLLYISEDLKNKKSYYSAIFDDSKLTDVLNNYSWDISFGDGRPGFIFYGDDAKYNGIGDDGKELLIYDRTWSGKSDRIFEISQEFVLYYDLYKNGENYIKIHDDGSEENVILITKNEVKVKLKYVKEYLSVKNKKLVIYFEFMKFGNFDGEEFENKIEENNLIYRFLIRKYNYDGNSNQSWLLGKKVIEGKKDFKPTLFEKEEYESFYVGVDENGEERFFTCEPDLLANYFGANQNSPHYLTPINFRREVLDVYYANPTKYSIGDSSISMEGFWYLRIDNNLDDKIGVFLGDLGRDIPYSEQKHWKKYEIKEKGKISTTYYERSFEGKFSDAETPELYFKSKYLDFNKKWKEKFGWKFFKDFSEGDNHLLKSLHSLNHENNQKEFDEQVLILTKILIDYLNERDIYNEVLDELKEDNLQGISKLEKFLITKHSDNNKLIKFFRDLQFLRSKCSAHQKGKDYKKALELFSEGKLNLKEIFEEILIRAVTSLNTLENRFLK